MSLLEERKQKRIVALRGIIIGRWFLISGLALLGLIQKIAGITIVSLSIPVWAILVGVPILYNTGYYLFIRRPEEQISARLLGVIGFLQVIVDQIMFTALIYLTGGVESVAYILYFFPILSATILYSDLEIISLSILTIFWYSAVIILEFNGTIPHFPRYDYDPGFFRNTEVTLANTISIDMILLFTAMFSVFVNRIIHGREMEITVERDKVRSILNSLEDGIIMLDSRKQVLLLNPPARDILRLYDDFTGPELHKADFPNSFSKLIHSIREQPETKRLGQEVIVEEGEDKSYIQVDTIPIYSGDGTILSWVKVLHDITREKELDEIKSDFISIAAHQLRTPLAALKWFFKIMSEGDAGKINERQAELLEKAFQRNNEVIEIVNNLLDVSEIEEGRFPYEFAEDDLTEVVKSVVNSARIDSERKDVTVMLKKSKKKLPPVEMDKQKMRMAIQNLVDNAVKYSSQGSTVAVTVTIKNNRYFITIADHGIGIPKDEQAKIFSKFFRGKNAKEKETAGSGLGLYIVKNIVQRHRGQVWFESEINRGTTFFLSFPVSRSYLAKDSKFKDMVDV